MEPGMSLLDHAGDLNFDIARGNEEEEALAEVRKKAEELKEAVANGFDDLVGLSDDEDDDISTDQFLEPPAHMGYGGTTSTPITESQNYMKQHFPASGYIVAPRLRNNEVDGEHYNLANGLDAPRIPGTDNYDLGTATDNYCGGGDVGNGVPTAPLGELPSSQAWTARHGHSDEHVQLQVMYKARMREVERLSSELESLKQASRVEISSLNVQLSALQQKENMLVENFNQMRASLANKTSENAELSVKLVTLENQLEIETKTKEENLQKMQVAESTIKMLQEQVSELSRSDGFVLMKRDYEKILQNLKEKHHNEVYDLNLEITALNQKLTSKVTELRACEKRLEEQEQSYKTKLLEKAEAFNKLTQSLNMSQKQCQYFLENGTTKSPSHLLSQFGLLQEDRAAEQRNIKSLEEELQNLFQILLPKTTLSAYNSEFSKSDNSSETLKLGTEVLTMKIKSCCREARLLRSEIHKSQEALTAVQQELELLRRKSEMSENEVATLHEKLQARDGSETESQFQDVKDELQKHVQALEEQLAQTEAAYQETRQRELALLSEKDSVFKSYAEDKAQAVDVCKNSILEMHHAAMKRLREELLSLSEQEKLRLVHEYEAKVRDLNSDYGNLQQTINDIKELYIRSCEEKRALESRIKELLLEQKTMKEDIEGRLHEEFRELLRKAKPVWEAEMMKHFEEQIETNMKETKQEWEALKQTELEQIQENLRREYQEEYNKAIQEEREKIGSEQAALSKQLHDNCPDCENRVTLMQQLEHDLQQLKQTVKKQLTELQEKEAELDSHISASSERESSLKVKLLKYQKKLQKLQEDHKNQLMSLENGHAANLSSLQTQLRQLSLKSSDDSDNKAQASITEVLHKWSNWFKECLDKVYKEVCEHMEASERAKDVEIRQLLHGYHQFLVAQRSLGSVEVAVGNCRNRKESKSPARFQSRPVPRTTPPEKPFADKDKPPQRLKSGLNEKPHSRQGCGKPLFSVNTGSRDYTAKHSENAGLRGTTPTELDLSAMSDGSVFLSPPGRVP